MRKRKRILLLSVSLLIALGTGPASKGGNVKPTESENATLNITMHVKGMGCSGCAPAIESALKKVPGVLKADVRFNQNEAYVEYQKGKTTPEKLLNAVQKAGFNASVKEHKLVSPAKGNQERSATQGVQDQDKRVVDFLIEEWQQRFRSTNIEQAMERLKLSYSHTRRMSIASRLVADPQVVEKMRWQPATYILTNNEKRMARIILGDSKASGGRAPAAKDLAQAAGVGEREVKDGLDVLSWLGFLEHQDGDKYLLTADHKRFLNGLGFNFHELVLQNGDRFNIN